LSAGDRTTSVAPHDDFNDEPFIGFPELETN
jgi:hypothetical protein